MEEITQIINRVLPILLLLFLGYWFRQKGFLAEKTIDELRKVVVNTTLSAVLFISFLDVGLKSTYAIIFLIRYDSQLLF